MILYLDTSALVKLHLDEWGSDRVLLWTDQSDRLLTAIVTYTEARAAFVRRARERTLASAEHAAVVQHFERGWSRYEVLSVDDRVVRRAASLAERHALRAFDAIQLAAALEARPDRGTMVFGSFDERLNRAAVREGLALPREPDLVADRPRAVVARRRAG